jgi:magnesium transporter
VAYGSVGLDKPMVEVHCFYSEHFLVSVHRVAVPAIADACTALGRLYTDRRLVALYRLLDALVDSMFPFLTAFDDRIDELQDQIFAKPTDDQLVTMFALKRQLVDMRKVDSYRDLLSGSLDAYMSVVSNRLNDVMKQLTIIATVFLPLSFLTGFFGQNFAWLVDRMGSLGVFLGVGLGTEAVAVFGLLFMFRRRGWM